MPRGAEGCLEVRRLHHSAPTPLGARAYLDDPRLDPMGSLGPLGQGAEALPPSGAPGAYELWPSTSPCLISCWSRTDIENFGSGSSLILLLGEPQMQVHQRERSPSSRQRPANVATPADGWERASCLASCLGANPQDAARCAEAYWRDHLVEREEAGNGSPRPPERHHTMRTDVNALRVAKKRRR